MGGTRDIWIAASALSMILAGQAEAVDHNIKGGVAGYVRPPVTSHPPSGPARRLHIGDAIFHNERIVTGAGGSAQIVMLDKTTLTVGPDAELVIEEYRYDRKARDGNMAIRAIKGLFRFVGGFVSKRNPVQVRVPTGTIGIRGAVVAIEVLPGGGVRMTFMYGDQATYDGDNGESTSISRGGDVLEIGPDGSINITQASADDIAAMQQKLSGPRGADIEMSSVSDADGLELIESLSGEDPELNIDLLEEALNLDDAEFEEVRDALEEIQAGDAGSGGVGP